MKPTKLSKALLFFPIIVFLLNGCTEPVEDGLPGDESDPSYYHSTGWGDNHQSGNDFSTNPQNCKACHGEYVNGGPANVSCFSTCHQDYDKCNCCHDNNGTSASHKTHNTVNNYYRGPGQLACQDCHDSGNHPNFTDGRNSANTTVCNTCHSPGGSYDGVNDATIGAKANWANGVYTGSFLTTGKEKWCVGCHDDVPGNSKQDGTGVDAPNVAGDNTTYGYYANGHGNAPNDTELLCTDCHDVSDDVSVTHIDEDDRTYTFTGYDGGAAYQEGYRLISIGGEVPMKIPANVRVADDNTDYRLCLSCHDSSKIFDDTEDPGPPPTFDSNFSVSGDDPPKGYSYDKDNDGVVSINMHDYHLNVDIAVFPSWDSDWNLSTGGSWDAYLTCVTCHNVHGAEGCAGSTNEAMIRDGKLVDGRPNDREGFRFSYVIEDTDLGGDFVTSSGATRENSIGAVFSTDTLLMGGEHMCRGCHGVGYSVPGDVSYDATGNYLEYYRDPN